MHVIPHLANANLEETYMTALTRGIEVQLRELVAPVDSKGLDLKVRVESGLPWRLIHNVAQATKPDLIVMNIHGKSRLDRMLLGSTAERIIRSQRRYCRFRLATKLPEAQASPGSVIARFRVSKFSSPNASLTVKVSAYYGKERQAAGDNCSGD
jgi:hypothetical protein